MKTKLLKRIRSKYHYVYREGMWIIYRLPSFPIGYCETTHKALDIMAAPMLAFSELTRWYRKVFHLHGTWGKFHIYYQRKRK